MLFTLASENANAFVGLAAIIGLGISCQWFAWRLRVPSILLLLTTGLAVGPIAQLWRGDGQKLIDPQSIFGSFLMPFVSLAVALILFEGGLSLKLRDLKHVGRPVLYLCSIGAVVTWVIAATAGHYVLNLDWRPAVLLGAVLVVTGPTVITPLLQHIRPSGPVAPILKWEGIVIDPIGALLAVLVYEVIVTAHGADVNTALILAVVKTVLVAGLIGSLSALALGTAIRRFWIPDRLQTAASLALAVTAFAASNHFQAESGLFAVTLMGLVLGNLRNVDVEKIIEFKENIVILLISSLFILLAARLSSDLVTAVSWREAVFVGVLVLVARPISAWLSTYGAGLKFNERAFVAWMAPRGIVAAAVASIFAEPLKQHGYEQADMLVGATFATILGTVTIYGLTAPWAARRLGVAESNPQGLLLIGADVWSRAVAEILKKKNLHTLLVDSNRDHIAAARMAGLNAYHGNILSEYTLEKLELGGIGRVVATTPNDYVNVLALQGLARLFGAANVYQIAPQGLSEDASKDHAHLFGRPLFDSQATFDHLHHRLFQGAVIKATPLSEEFDFEAFQERYHDPLVLFVIDENDQLRIGGAYDKLAPKPGQTVVCLVNETP